MRIGVDLTPLRAREPASLRRTAERALAALERLDGLEVVGFRAPERGAAAWRQLALPRLARRAGVDGLHSLLSGFSLPTALLRVATVHELPWRHGVRENAGFAHRAWTRLGAAACARLVVPTEVVASDLVADTGVPRARVAVLPWGVEAERFETTARWRDAPDRAYLLQLGGTRAKKGLDLAVRALARLGSPRPALVVTGAATPWLARCRRLAAELGVVDDLLHREAVDAADLPAALATARCVLVPSRSEGFAHPVLEALAAGVAPVVPRDSAACETASGQGVPFEPGDAASLAEAIARASAERDDPLARASRRARARQCGWERWANGVRALWAAVLAEAPR